jgi:hypothetical protein
VSAQLEEKTKKGAMPPHLSYRYLGHKKGVALGQALWDDPRAGLHGYDIRTTRPTTVIDGR